MKTPNPKSEFYRVCNEIKRAGIARIVVHKKRRFVNTSIGGYVSVNTNPPVIHVECKTKQPYEQLLYYLLHEVGHILDYSKYSKSKRWKIAEQFEYGSDIERTAEYSNKIKFELLRTEAIAENYIEILLKRYKVDFQISDMEMKAQYNQSMFAMLFEFAYGRSSTDKERTIIRSISEKQNRLTLQDFHKFIKDKGLFFRFCFGSDLSLAEK